MTFTADLEEKLDRVSNHEIDWKQVLRDFWRISRMRSHGTKDLRTTQVLDSLNDFLGPHIFPAKEDGSESARLPLCGNGQLSLKLGKFGAFIGCSNYPECKFTRTLSNTGDQSTIEGGDRPGVRVLGIDPATGEEISSSRRPVRRLCAARRRRQAETVLAAEDDRSRPIHSRTGDRTPVAAARESPDIPRRKQPILAGIGRFGPYVQHGKTYANIGKDDEYPGDRRQPRDRSHRRQRKRALRPSFRQ